MPGVGDSLCAPAGVTELIVPSQQGLAQTIAAQDHRVTVDDLVDAVGLRLRSAEQVDQNGHESNDG
jgi:hypothetical protein